MLRHLFISGVPATGKTWLGTWLAEKQGYVHIDAEKDGGSDFDGVGIHSEFDELLATGRANALVRGMERIGKPVVLNWGMRMEDLFVVTALQEERVGTWWLRADREPARKAFIDRGGIDPKFFDSQMAQIERYASLLCLVFKDRIIEGLQQDGSQRHPKDLWAEITARSRR